MTRRSIRLLSLVTFVGLSLPEALVAGQPSSKRDESPVPEATRRRDSGDFAGAAALLRPWVARHPAQLDSALVLAQLLYWLKDAPGARALYEQTLVQHPKSTPLRLDYGRMLLETGDHQRLTAVVAPALRDPSGRARAESLLGRSAYWQGDLTSARAHFRSAREADPADKDAVEGLREIQAGMGSWLRAGADASHDDQPLDRQSLAAEAGWYVGPVTTVALRGSWARLSSSSPSSFSRPQGTLRLTHYAAAARTDLELEGGAAKKSGGGAEWIGHADIGLRLSSVVRARASLARDAYLHTLASLEAPVVTRTGRVIVALDHPSGWLGEAAIQRQWYPDANRSAGAYAWLLAPIVNGGRRQLQVGYSASSQTADESRFVPVSPRRSSIAPDGRILLEGRYAPYYTPDHVATQSLLIAGMVRTTFSATLRASGSYGFHATEKAPELELTAGTRPGLTTVVRTATERAFHPWTARASVEFRASPDVTLAFSVEASRTAFYKTATGGLQLLWRSDRK